ncbi:MAG: FAD:protein FMN transferase [Candidatus Omnitrophica bacterium]|nr:FAD:protein FMN transferase [Candidatus Omnitrophota bacterium]MDD5690596.1 FAD:protein FMN transferase [Candidatus Omnitrophota bacterium]
MTFNPKARRYLITLLIIGWMASLSYFALRSRKPDYPKQKTTQLYHNNRLLMGTFWEVSSPDKEASLIVFAEAKRIENLLSKYIPESEISQLNRAGRLKASPDTFFIIKKAKEYWQASAGAFDITIAPLTDLWGFTNQEHKIPGEDLIKAALKLVGCDKIILHEKNNMVEFKFPGMKIDLGAIAKGFALDCAVTKLKEKNINSCLINAGGQVYALGEGPAGPWKIAIQNPRKPEITGILELKNKSISTSGDYEQFFLKDGKRYCHIIDPKTGHPATSGISSVTVITDSALEADVLSTAIFVLGKKESREMLNKFPQAEVKVF